MAEINAKDLTAKTSPASTDSMLLFGTTSNEGAKITVDNLADNILSRLTTKTFANQVGGSSAATILAQLATLNSKIVFPFLQLATSDAVLPQTIRYGTGDVTQSFGTIITGNVLFIFGRARISNFVRTGGGPGITITLPSEYLVDGNIGYGGTSSQIGGVNGVGNSIRARENNIVFAYNAGREIYVSATETYTNVGNGDFWLSVPFVCVKLKKA